MRAGNAGRRSPKGEGMASDEEKRAYAALEAEAHRAVTDMEKILAIATANYESARAFQSDSPESEFMRAGLLEQCELSVRRATEDAHKFRAIERSIREHRPS